MPVNTSKRILINYRGAPAWNTALNFSFWLFLSLSGFNFAYLFLAFMLDGAIRQDNVEHSGSRQGNPDNYGNVVELNLKAIPFIGRFLYS